MAVASRRHLPRYSRQMICLRMIIGLKVAQARSCALSQAGSNFAREGLDASYGLLIEVIAPYRYVSCACPT